MIILVGASACGKTVLAKYLIDTYHFTKFVTTTTRKMRDGEKQNIDYHFITPEEFINKINTNKFIEYVTYNNQNYGSEKTEIGTNKILIIEPIGLEKYLSLHDKTIITFYIECEKSIRKKRMIERGDNLNDVNERLKNDETIFTSEIAKKVDFVLDSSKNNIATLGDEIYKLYINKITSSR